MSYEFTEVPIPKDARWANRALAHRDPRPPQPRRFLDITGLSEGRVDDLRLIVAAYKDQERLQRIADAEAAKAAAR